MADFSSRLHFSVLDWMRHILLATVMFAAIALAAFGLHLLVHWMEQNHLEPVLVTALRWVTYFLIVIDILVFVFYSLKTTHKFIYKIGRANFWD